MKTRSLLIVGSMIFLGGFLIGCQPKELTSAKVYINQNDWDKATEQLELAVQAYPQNPEAHYMLGRAYGMKARFEDMNKEFETSLNLAPTFQKQIEFERNKYWVESFNKGVRAFNQEKMDEAVELFTTAITISPDKPESYRNIGVAYLRLDQPEKAMENLEKAIALEPDHINTLTNLGLVQMQTDHKKEAIATFEKILQLDPKNADAINNLGILYDQTGQADKAIASYKDALAANPNNPDLMFNYARLMYQRRDFDAAIVALKPLLAAQPDDFEANITMADSYLQLADGKRKEANDLETGNNKANEAKVKVLREEAKSLYSQAIPFLLKGTELKPDVKTIWYNLGVAYINMGEKAKGEAAFKKADELEKANK